MCTRPNVELMRRRVEKGMSRQDVARMAGLSTKQLGLIERGKVRRPRETTMLAIARAVGAASPLDLFSLEDRMRR
jgi:transcriptional regulator with XRE-family HTH domain